MIAYWIQAEMDKRGMSQRELSRRSGVHLTTVNRFLNGHQNITIPTLEALLSPLHVIGFRVDRKAVLASIEGKPIYPVDEHPNGDATA